MSEAFGRPVEGEISHYTSKAVEQQDPQLWLDALDRLLAVPGVRKVRWRAYTPYFNDGEPCEYGVSGTAVLFEGLEEDPDGGGLGDYGDNYLDPFAFRYSRDDLAARLPDVDLSASGELYQALQHFSSANEGGAHDVMLRNTFGDPAEVTATREGFSVEFYKHD